MRLEACLEAESATSAFSSSICNAGAFWPAEACRGGPGARSGAACSASHVRTTGVIIAFCIPAIIQLPVEIYSVVSLPPHTAVLLVRLAAACLVDSQPRSWRAVSFVLSVLAAETAVLWFGSLIFVSLYQARSGCLLFLRPALADLLFTATTPHHRTTDDATPVLNRPHSLLPFAPRQGPVVGTYVAGVLNWRQPRAMAAFSSLTAGTVARVVRLGQ